MRANRSAEIRGIETIVVKEGALLLDLPDEGFLPLPLFKPRIEDLIHPHAPIPPVHMKSGGILIPCRAHLLVYRRKEPGDIFPTSGTAEIIRSLIIDCVVVSRIQLHVELINSRRCELVIVICASPGSPDQRYAHESKQRNHYDRFYSKPARAFYGRRRRRRPRTHAWTFLLSRLNIKSTQVGMAFRVQLLKRVHVHLASLQRRDALSCSPGRRQRSDCRNPCGHCRAGG